MIVFHRAHFDTNGGNKALQGINAFLKVAPGDKLRMLAGNEEDVSKALIVEMFRFCDHLWDGQGRAKNWVVSRKTAVLAVVDTFV